MLQPAAGRYRRIGKALDLNKSRSKMPVQDIEIIPALPADQPVLANLLELYIHDFSSFFDLKLGADGRFGYSRLPLYWTEPGRHPFLIRVDGQLAGFALVRRGSEISDDENVWDLAEFFIARGFRRRGTGRRAAHLLWRRFPGQWEIRVYDQNQPAHAFWIRAITAFLGEPARPTAFSQDGKASYVFSFRSTDPS